MKILQVITSLHTGGAEKLVVDIVPRLQAKGHEVAVVVLNGEETPFMIELRKCHCKIYCLSMKGDYYNPLHILRLRKIMRHYDVIHTHNSSPQLFVAIANIFCKKRIVTTEHNTSNRRRKILGFRVIDKWMYSQYMNVICISDKAFSNLVDYLGEKEESSKTVTIYNGIDVDRFFRATPVNGMKSDKFIILMVAAFRKQKDQDTLVKCMKYLPSDRYELWLAGEGERIDEVRELARSEGVDKNVIFLGNRTDVPLLLKTADVIVMSTHYEGLSLSNIEGMSSNKPFVASDVDGIHEVTVDAGILVPPQKPEVLADTIMKLSSDESYYKEVADRCYRRARQFDISTMVEKYNQVYLSLFEK